MADTRGLTPEPGLEARVARLEADVAHIRSDLGEVKSTLSRLAPRIDEMHGFLTAKLPELATKAQLAALSAKLPELANKAELAAVRLELKEEIDELRIEIIKRPTRRQSILDIFAIVGFIGVVLTIAARFAR